LGSLILLPNLGKRFEHRPAPGALISLILDAETLNRPGSPSHLLNSRKKFEHRPAPGAKIKYQSNGSVFYSLQKVTNY